ncbi:MAG: alkyl hydroperoxide reductase/Thiol specific antioxidant/Mal allergen [Xanthobacteraceae bacterium]|jgi:peroxiredoxin Q/BCP|nr:alkyl hydroperoxide reductase/Thiol specific antioxidant/Mal allergen [Xanthobacteraceae bacterium]
MTTLAAGDPAPDFTLPAPDGGKLSLADFADRKLVIYFYPKAGTEACTREAHDFNELRGEFDAAGTSLLGVSPDGVKALGRFKAKHDIGFPLIGDEAHQLIEAYGIWVEKSMYGRRFMGVERTSVLIDTKGRIARIWPKVKVAGHAEEVLAAARAL